MRSPVENRLEQISIAQTRNLEIVEDQENSPSDEKICVAVGKDLLESISALKWALYNRLEASLILLHVQLPIRFIPSPVGNIPVNQVCKDILNAHKEDEHKKLSECMELYLDICAQAKAKAEIMIVEKTDVSKGIVEVVSEQRITKLAIGTSSSTGISKKMKMQGPGKADYVQRHAVEFCEVSIVCKEKLVQMREATTVHNAQKPMNYMIPLSQLLGKRSETATFKHSSVQGGLSVSSFRTPSISLVNEDCISAWVEEVNGRGLEDSSFENFYSHFEEEDSEKIQSEEAYGTLSSIHAGGGSQVCSLH